LSQLGGALVLMGRLEEGAPLLDEAMAGALGGEGGRETVVRASCVTIVCCSRAAELKRAAQWIRAAGEFNRRYGSPHLDAVCRTAYGAVLLATGKWAEAETQLGSGLQKMSKTARALAHSFRWSTRFVSVMGGARGRDAVARLGIGFDLVGLQRAAATRASDAGGQRDVAGERVLLVAQAAVLAFQLRHALALCRG
jgi:ATP/maltotriose-dependent transcriptional regulator MalT